MCRLVRCKMLFMFRASDPVKIFADFNKYYEDFQLLSKSTSIENELAFPCVYYVDYENVSFLSCIVCIEN